MPSGKLGSADLTAATDTVLYTVPPTTVASASVSFVNRTASPVKVRLSAGSAATPAAADYLLYDAVVPPTGEPAGVTGLALSPGEKVVARADAAGVSVRVHGFEETE